MAPKKPEVQEAKILGRQKGNLKMGLVGLPNVGKSTTFNLLSKQSVPAENFPFCTIKPHEARMVVPDARFDKLCEHFNPKSQVPAHLSFFDIAGLVPNAHQGEGLGNAFLSHIGAVDGIYNVVRCFEDTDIVHSEGQVDPIADLNTIRSELRLKDVEKCSTALNTKKKMGRSATDKVLKDEIAALEGLLEHLDAGKWITEGTWKTSDVDFINEYQFLTAKPVVYLVNMSEADFVRKRSKWLVKIQQWVKEHNPGDIVPFSASYEQKLEALGEPAASEYAKEHGGLGSQLHRIVTAGHRTLNLAYFFTAGEDEVRSWAVRKGTKAPQAAAQIHTDFEKYFICAEVYSFTDFEDLKSEVAIRSAGKLLQKGKEYVVEDGDVINIKHGAAGAGAKGGGPKKK